MEFKIQSRQTRTLNCKKCAYKSENEEFRGIHIKGCEAPSPIHKVCRFSYNGYWKRRFVPTFRKGDKVIFNDKNFEHYKKEFVVSEDSFPDGNLEVVFCENLSSCWSVNCFDLVK